jgi:hypothetical protein
MISAKISFINNSLKKYLHLHRLRGITVIPNGFMIWSNYGGHADTDSSMSLS